MKSGHSQAENDHLKDDADVSREGSILKMPVRV